MSLANAIIQGNQEYVQYFLSQGVDINEFDEYGFTPLIEAAIANHTNIAKYLIDQGADVNKKDAVGSTAMHWAIENNNIALAECLLSAGADPNAHNLSAEPVLIRPILREQHEMKNLLFKYGAKSRFANDYIHLKLLGHRWDLTGEIDIVTTETEFAELSFEGFFLESSIHIMRQSLHQFINNFGSKDHTQYFDIYKQVISAMHNAAELIKYQQYQTNLGQHQNRIQKLLSERLLILPVNYDGHAISFVRYGKYWVRCDRRREDEGMVNGILIFEMDQPHALTTQLLQFLIYEKKDKDFIDNTLAKQLGLKLRGRIMIEPQVTGNCSWASIAACVPVIFFLLTDHLEAYPGGMIDSNHLAITQYHAWRDWDKSNALTYCIQNFQSAEPARKASLGAALAAVFFQRFDYRQTQKLPLARRILRLLRSPGHEYHLKHYLNQYTVRNRTEAGGNLKKLIAACDSYI